MKVASPDALLHIALPTNPILDLRTRHIERKYLKELLVVKPNLKMRYILF